MDDEDFLKMLGGSSTVAAKPVVTTERLRAAFSEPISLNLDELFADDEETRPTKKASTVRGAEKKNADKLAQIGRDMQSLSDVVNKKVFSLAEELTEHKSSVEKRLAKEETKAIKAELTRLGKEFFGYVKDNKNKVEIRIDAAETVVMKKELERMAKILKEVGKYEYGSSLNILQAGTPIGFTGSINFKTGFSVALNGQGIDVSVSGGGFTTLIPTETPNGVRAVFTLPSATAKPSFVISDGVWMQATAKDGTVNWTWNSGTKKSTMTIPPTDDLLGVV